MGSGKPRYTSISDIFRRIWDQVCGVFVDDLLLFFFSVIDSPPPPPPPTVTSFANREKKQSVGKSSPDSILGTCDAGVTNER